MWKIVVVSVENEISTVRPRPGERGFVGTPLCCVCHNVLPDQRAYCDLKFVGGATLTHSNLGIVTLASPPVLIAILGYEDGREIAEVLLVHRVSGQIAFHKVRQLARWKTSDCFTQARSDSSPTPSWRATLEITARSPRSCRRSSLTIRTARSFSSGGYRFAVAFFSVTPSSLPRYGASGDPRPVQWTIN